MTVIASFSAGICLAIVAGVVLVGYSLFGAVAGFSRLVD